MGRLIKFSVFILLIGMSACHKKQIVPLPTQTVNYEEEKIAVNQEIARRELADINLIAQRYGWNLTKTESGLLYMIENKNDSPRAQKGNRVQIKGTITLADGSIFYDSKTDGIKEFTIDGSEDIVGLHELVKLMGVGEKANAIIPSFLAYGISGDGLEVPALSSMICEIELIKIL